jgi:hypothetical protein
VTALMVEEICEFLVSFSPAITLGTPAAALSFNPTGSTGNIYGFDMPDKPDACISIWPYGGSLPHLVDNVDEPTFQVKVRDMVVPSGEKTIQGVFNALHGIYERALVPAGDWYWNRMFALQNPIYLGRDDVQRHLWVQNFRGFVRNPFRGVEGAVDH